jgi:hypothetical protein
MWLTVIFTAILSCFCTDTINVSTCCVVQLLGLLRAFSRFDKLELLRLQSDYTGKTPKPQKGKRFVCTKRCFCQR